MLMKKFDPTFPHKSHEARGFKKRTCLCEAQNWRCCYCGILFSDDQASDAYPTFEHVVPIVAGGSEFWENEVMACRLCNEARGAMYARNYLQHVIWKGREAAARWGRRRSSKVQSRNAKRRASKAAAIMEVQL